MPRPEIFFEHTQRQDFMRRFQLNIFTILALGNFMTLEKTPRASRIVSTLGPASESLPALEAMIRAGMNIARLNFSHGSRRSHEKIINSVRDASRSTDRQISILQDLQGHKVRVGKVLGAEGLQLSPGRKIRLGSGGSVTAERIGVDYDGIENYVEPGYHIYLSDGMIDLQVVDRQGTDLLCEVIIEGLLKSRNGAIFPHCDLKFPLINDKDLADAEFGVKLGVDMIAMSFVRSATEIFEMRIRMGEWGNQDSFIIAKIEDQKGVNNIDEILDVADGILIARGDLGVCLPREKVPGIQAQIIQKANARGVPVITATQMLESMIYHHRPTRAEVTDVYDAISAGSDAVMLSGETASGRYPVQAIEEMDRICRVAEKELKQRHPATVKIRGREGLHDRMAEATAMLVKSMQACCVIGLSLTGSTLRSLAATRIGVPIYGVVASERLSRQLLLHRGLFIITMPQREQLAELVNPTLELLKAEKIITAQDRVVVVAGEIDDRGRRTHLAKVVVID
jgi:pyruvate kinase